MLRLKQVWKYQGASTLVVLSQERKVALCYFATLNSLTYRELLFKKPQLRIEYKEMNYFMTATGDEYLTILSVQGQLYDFDRKAKVVLP